MTIFEAIEVGIFTPLVAQVESLLKVGLYMF